MQRHGHRGAAGGAPSSLGAGDGPIRIVDYDPSWPAAYIAERRRLAKLLPGLRVYHIGSTSVPGLAAKPVIDMIALVDDLDAYVATLRRAGYHVPAQFNANLTHRCFLCYPTLSHRTHHLHLVDEHAGVDQCLRFRDRLANDPALAAEYVALKRALAGRFRADRMSYTEAKSSFIKDALGEPTATKHRAPSREPTQTSLR
jgi:GrpB-like predicted nucleotidyltransferase (UPF0157 family)